MQHRHGSDAESRLLGGMTFKRKCKIMNNYPKLTILTPESDAQDATIFFF